MKKEEKKKDTWIISEQKWWYGGGKPYFCKNGHHRTNRHVWVCNKAWVQNSYLHVCNILDIGHLVPKVLSHIYMPHKMIQCQPFSDLSVFLQSCETTSHAHIQPTWAQYVTFYFLLHAILCFKTFTPASYDKFSWKGFRHGCPLTLITVPGAMGLSLWLQSSRTSMMQIT